MSVDLVGSTALKQSGEFPIKEPRTDAKLPEAGARWILDLATFYRDIEAKFIREWSSYCDTIAIESRWPTDAKFRLWKINGDELIYVSELPSSRDAVALLWCWMAACKAYRKDLIEKKSKLDVKMTAWTAGFPVSNTEVVFKKRGDDETDDWDPISLHYALIEKWHESGGTSDELTQDFIGPSIDTGFRLAGRSTPRKFIISVELAYILSITAAPSGMNMKIGYDGQTELKGVFGGRPYPLFWIDSHADDELSRAEDALGLPRHPQFGSIRNFCDQYIQSNDTFMLKPFIWNDPEPLLCEIPRFYQEKLLQIAHAWERAKANREAYVGSRDDREAPPSTDVEAPAGDVEVKLPNRKTTSYGGENTEAAG